MAKEKGGKGTGCMTGQMRSPGADYMLSHPKLNPSTLGLGMSNVMKGGGKRVPIKSPMANEATMKGK